MICLEEKKVDSTGLEPASLGFAPIALSAPWRKKKMVAHGQLVSMSHHFFSSMGQREAMGAKPRDASSSPVESTFLLQTY